jgi:multiple sugar transport system ATP-binding protein
MKVDDYMGFSLKLPKVDRAEIDQLVRRVAEILNLTDFLRCHSRQLSGGQ